MTRSNNSNESRNRSEPTKIRYKPLLLDNSIVHKTQGNIGIGTLNIKGATLTNGAQKWGHINQIMKHRGLGILAVQETHLCTDDLEKLNNLPNLRDTVFMTHTTLDNKEHSAGVSIIINKQKLPTTNVRLQTIIPGRALLTMIPWRENLTLNVLAVYAPNNAREN